MRGSGTEKTLATRIMWLTFALVSISALMAATLALVGVYQLASQETAGRVQGLRDLLAEDTMRRLDVARQVVETIATREVLGQEDVPTLRQSVYRFSTSNADYFDVLIVAGPTGNVLAAWPSVMAPADVSGEPYFDPSAGSEEVDYEWVSEDGAEERLWLRRTVDTPAGPRTLMAAVRLSPLGSLAREIAAGEEGRAVSIVGPDGEPVVQEPAPTLMDPDSLEYREGENGGDRVTATHSRLGELAGYYADVKTGDLEWRVMVLEPAFVPFERTRAALLPASITVVAAVLIATWLAYVFGKRLVTPLREFERRAEEVTAGAYVQPIELDRRDEVGRLADGFNAMASRLNSLQDLSQVLANASDIDQVLDGILSSMGHLLNTSQGAVFLVDPHADELVLARSSRVEGVERVEREVSVPVSDPSWVAHAFRAGAALSFIVQPQHERRDRALEVFPPGSVSAGLAVPLTVGRLPIGVALALSAERRTFSEAEMEIARTFAAQAAIAVQNSRLFEEEHSSRLEAESLRDMAELLASPLGLEETLQRVGEIAAHAIGFSACSVVISTRDRDDLMMPPAQDPEREHAYRRLWAHERQLAGPVLEDEPLLVPDLERYRGTEMGSGLSEDVDSVLMIPMHEGDRLRGVLVLECVDDRKALGDTERAFARATVQTISVALESASLFKQAAQRAENLETVFRISQAVSLSLQSSVVLDRVLDVVQKILTADGVALLRFDPHQDAMTTAMARGLRDRSLLDLVLEPGQDVPGAVFESKEPVRIDDVTRVDTPVSHMLQAQGFRSWLAVPLIARGRSIGVLNAFSDHTGAFREEDVDLMATFASQGALAIDTAELFGREHRIASVLQSSIIPGRLPEIPGMRFASEYEAASAEAEIGGDYYDVFRAPDGRVVLAVGDVCGKGVDAATRTSMIKYTLRGLVAAGLEPAVALEELNTAVAEMGNIADIVTMWVAYVDPEIGRMTYVNGGHPPAFLLLPDGEVEALEPTGPILGAVVAAEYGQDTRTVADGSTLLIYTDGVTEARTDGELFGEARVRGVLEAGGEPEEIVTRLLEAVRRYTDGSLRDDVAVLAVRLERSVTRED